MVASDSGQAFVAAASLMGTGDAAARTGDWKRAAASYEEAIAIAAKAPGHDWDQRGFLAVCHAVLSTPLLQLGRHEEALRAADVALEFLDRHGQGYPSEAEKWFTARRNKAAALASFGRFEEAAGILEQAKGMLAPVAQSEPASTLLDRQIAQLRGKTARAGRPWWRSWF